MSIAAQLLTPAAINQISGELQTLTSNLSGSIATMQETLNDELLITPIAPPPYDGIIGQPYVDHGVDSTTTELGELALSSNRANLAFGEGNLPDYTQIAFTPAVPRPVMPAAPGAAPVVAFPSAPTLVDPTPPTAPVINTPSIPDAPVLEYPDKPVLLELTLPDITPISIPPFELDFPLYDGVVPPAAGFEYNEPEYTSEELVALRALLVDNLLNAGWGVDHVDEEALFEREVDRTTAAGITNEDIVIEAAASRGFALPTGAAVAALRRNQQDTLNKISDANRDVSITRADLIRKSREHTINSSLQLNQTMVTHFGFVQQRALEAAKSVVDYSIRVFDAHLSMYNVQLAAFKAYTDAYEFELRAQLIRLEAEKAQLEAEMQRNEINKVNVEIYNSLVRVLALEIEIYNTEMQAAKIASDIEQNKVQVYVAQINAYDSQIRAEISKIQSYTAQVSAEGTKVDVYRSEVQAYATNVGAVKLVSDVDIQIGQFELEGLQLKLEEYRANIINSRTLLDAERARAGMLVSERATEMGVTVDKGRLTGSLNDLSLGYGDLNERAQLQDKQYTTDVERARVARDKIVAELNTDRVVTSVEQYRQYFESIGVFASDITVNNASI